MKCTIKCCSCRCSVSIDEHQIKKLSQFNCPVCGQTLNPEYIEKAKQCFQLVYECKHIKRDTVKVVNGIVDATNPFEITFEL